jgi:hypothetical protein
VIAGLNNTAVVRIMGIVMVKERGSAADRTGWMFSDHRGPIRSKLVVTVSAKILLKAF